MLDSADYAEDNPAITRERHAAIAAAVTMIDAGDEAGVTALEDALR